MMATRSYWLPVAGEVTNTNALLGHDGFVGMKTGSDEAAGGCLMFRAVWPTESGNRSLIGVVLGQRGDILITAGLYAAKHLVDPWGLTQHPPETSSMMEACGFRSYDCEWWHYTLKDEPYPDTYFDFPITSSTRGVALRRHRAMPARSRRLEELRWLRYLLVGRCVAPRLKPERRCPPRVAARAASWAGGGVRRTSRRSARSSGPSSARPVTTFGLTVRKSGPRVGSTTATITLELLGASNTIPSSSALPSATFTSSPTLAGFIP
jgi:hypothetical protein